MATTEKLLPDDKKLWWQFGEFRWHVQILLNGGFSPADPVKLDRTQNIATIILGKHLDQSSLTDNIVT